MNAAETNNELKLKPFSIAPLQGHEGVDHYRRLQAELEGFVNELVNAPGGCLLVTGYRGVGKTSFVNKALGEAEEALEARTCILVSVKLSLARGYSTDKLLRRLIRELYHRLNELGVYDHLAVDIQRKLEIAFLRTSRHVKAALSEGLKEIVSHTTSETTSRSTGLEFAPSVGIDKIQGALGSLSHARSATKGKEEASSRETARERGLELEFLEYDDEIAESDLCELIDSLVEQPASYPTAPTQAPPKSVPRTQLRSPRFLWRRLPAEFRIGRRTIRNYRSLPSSPELQASATPPTPKRLRLVFVLDEIDKMTVDQAEEIFRSLKNLFLKGNVTFVLVSGKELYYQWLMKRAAEDDVFFSLFTRIVHVPLFDDEEFAALAQSLLVDQNGSFPTDLLRHLTYRAKGTPREFLRELLRCVQWRDYGPVVSFAALDHRMLDIAGCLYPYVQAVYGPIAADDRIDVGIKDHLRRSLHNWLDWMTTLVTFDKGALMRSHVTHPASSDEVLLVTRARPCLDQLIQRLLDDGTIEQGGQIGNEPVYTFVSNIRAQLDAIDSSIALEFQSESLRREKEYRELLADAQRFLAAGDYSAALEAVNATADLPLGSELDQLRTERMRVKDAAEAGVKTKELIALGDRQLDSRQFRQAVETYSAVQRLGADSPEVQQKLHIAMLRQSLLEAEESYHAGTYDQALEVMFKASSQSRESTSAEVFALRQQVDAEMAKLREVAMLTREAEARLGKDPVLAVEMLDRLLSIARESAKTRELVLRLERVRDDQAYMRKAEIELQQGRFDAAEELLFKVQGSSSPELVTRSRSILNNISQIRELINEANHLLDLGQLGEAKNVMRNLDLLAKESRLSLQAVQGLRERAAILEQATKLENGSDAWLEEGQLEKAWSFLAELEALISQDVGVEFIYARTRRSLEKGTIEHARRAAMAMTNREDAVRRAELMLAPLFKVDPDNLEAKGMLQSLWES